MNVRVRNLVNLTVLCWIRDAHAYVVETEFYSKVKSTGVFFFPANFFGI